MSVIVRGSGPHHVIALNGWFGHAGDWGLFAGSLDEENFTWHFFEYRGYGSRRDEPGPFTLAGISAEVVAYLSSLDAEKVSLLGHSMGGAYMQRVLLDSDVPVTSLVGISAVPAAGTPFDPESRGLFESAGDNTASRRAIIDFTTGSRLPQRWLDGIAKASAENSTPEAVGGYFNAWADCDFAAELGVQELPVLIITGEFDPAVTKSGVQAAFSPIYRNLRVEELPDTGHYSIFEHPLGLAARVLAFLSEV